MPFGSRDYWCLSGCGKSLYKVTNWDRVQKKWIESFSCDRCNKKVTREKMLTMNNEDRRLRRTHIR